MGIETDLNRGPENITDQKPGTYKLYLKIERVPHSLNKKLRKHYKANHRENKLWDHLIGFNVARKKPPVPLTRAKVTIVRHASRTMDFDGLVGSLKPVVDALVTCGVLSDDSWKVLGSWNVHQRFRPLKEGQMLEILVQSLVDKGPGET